MGVRPGTWSCTMGCPEPITVCITTFEILDLRFTFWTELTVFPTLHDAQTLLVQNKVLGEDKGVMWNGHVVCTISKHEAWSHMRKEDLLNIAPGMDILLAVGIAYVRYDKQKTQAKIVSSNAQAANAASAAAATAS